MTLFLKTITDGLFPEDHFSFEDISVTEDNFSFKTSLSLKTLHEDNMTIEDSLPEDNTTTDVSLYSKTTGPLLTLS